MFDCGHISQYDCNICLSATSSREFDICQKDFDHQEFFLADFNFQVSSGLCLGTLPWILFYSAFLLMVDSWRLTKAKDKKDCRPLDIAISFFLNFFDMLTAFYTFLLQGFWQDNDFLEDSLLSQSFSACTECSWLEFSGASWSFWNDFGRLSRLTGVNIITLEMSMDSVTVIYYV